MLRMSFYDSSLHIVDYLKRDAPLEEAMEGVL